MNVRYIKSENHVKDSMRAKPETKVKLKNISSFSQGFV